jgi:hypothetical protein
MGDWLQDQALKRADLLIQVGYQVGDWVNMLSWSGKVWGQIANTFGDERDPKYLSAMVHTGRFNKPEYTHLNDVRVLHKKEDPWDDGEVYFAYDEGGQYSRWPKQDREEKPLPDHLCYHGTYTLQPWLWYYCNRSATPKVERAMEPIMEAAGVKSLTNVPWNEADAVMEKLRAVRIRGWHCVFQKKAEQQFKKSIQIHEGWL